MSCGIENLSQAASDLVEAYIDHQHPGQFESEFQFIDDKITLNEIASYALPLAREEATRGGYWDLMATYALRRLRSISSGCLVDL